MNSLLRHSASVWKGLTSSPFPTADGAGQSFNGTDQCAFVDDSGALNISEATTDFCFGGYFKPVDLTASSFLISKGRLEEGTYAINYYSGGIRLTFVTTTGVQEDIFYTGDSNVELHIVIRFDITNSKHYIYIDEILINIGGTPYTGTFPSNSVDFTLACRFNAGTPERFANARIRDVRIYHKDVTADIDKWMAGKQIGGEIAWWNLPTLTGFGGTTYDLTGVNL